jgi:cytochrome c oxidase subunit 4
MATKAPFETHHHLVPIGIYRRVIFALIVLMFLTVYVAKHPFNEIGPFGGTIVNQFIALLIAVIKASLVVLFFMGVRWSTTLTKFWALLGFAWLSFFTIMWGDYGTRQLEQVHGWDPTAESALPRTYEDHTGRAPKNTINVRPRDPN